jgi:V8-like Glu-specific endopeptidase
MQNIEKIFGMRVHLDDTLEPRRLESLKRRAQQLAARFDLNPEEHYVYLHSLSIVPNDEHFSKGILLRDRIHSARIAFFVNPKQQKSGSIRFFNHLFHDVLESDIDPYATPTTIYYTVDAHYMEEKKGFHNELITFVSKSLRKNHRKIKISITVRPTEAFKRRLRRTKFAVTGIDLHYERYTPLELPKRVQFVTGNGRGPKFIWRGPNTRTELHSFLHEEIPLDVGDMRRMVERSAAVCRIEIPENYPYGTGVLITPDLVLTNYHVLDRAVGQNGADLFAVAQNVTVRFGAVTDEMGKELTGYVLRLDTASPIIESSDTDELDFVLLRLERKIETATCKPVQYDLKLPEKKQALSILQHPVLDQATNPMKMTTSPNGVTGVYPEHGLIQYVTGASSGASGAPCFNTPQWNLVAIHHAEQKVPFGKKREGILFASIHEKINKYLNGG